MIVLRGGYIYCEGDVLAVAQLRLLVILATLADFRGATDGHPRAFAARLKVIPCAPCNCRAQYEVSEW